MQMRARRIEAEAGEAHPGAQDAAPADAAPPDAASPDAAPRKKRSWRAALVVVLVCAAAVEAILAFFDARAQHSRTHVLDWGTLRAISLEEARPGRVIHWTPSGDLFAYSDGYLERREYEYTVDADGFLMPSKVHDSPDVSIVFQGGSTTEIVFVDPEVRFAHLAGRLIEGRTGKTVNSYNAGVSGSFTLDSINSLLNKLAPYRPTYVVMMEAINDLNTLVYNHNSYYGRVRNPVGAIEQRRGRRTLSIAGSAGELGEAIVSRTVPHLAGRLRSLAAFLSGRQGEIDEFASVRHERRRVDPDAIRAAFRRNLRIYVQTARALGITPILMTQASRFYDPSPDWHAHIKADVERRTRMPFEAYRELHRSLNQVTRDVGAAEGVLVIDLEKRIPGRSEFIHDPVHFNNSGSRLAAQIISDAIVAEYLSN